MQGAKPDENIRRPMQWTAEGGFTTGQPWNAYFEDVAERNVAAQQADPNSLLSHYKGLIRLRDEHAALRLGDWRPVESDNRVVAAFLRFTADEAILVLANLGSQPVEDYALTLAEGSLSPAGQPLLLLGPEDTPLAAPQVDAADGFAAYKPVDSLPGNSSFFIRLAP